MKKRSSSALKPYTENELIEELIKNNDLAYETLVRTYSSKMYAVVRRFFLNEDDAQECLQKAFIQVFKNITSFKKNSSLMTWLHRITVNEALMMLRQKKRQKIESFDEFTQQYNEYGERTVFADEQGNSLDNNIERVFEKNESKSLLHDIILQLPEKYCNVLLLRDIQEISTRETAQILDISESLVKTQLHRARQLLKAILEKHNQVSLDNNWKVI